MARKKWTAQEHVTDNLLKVREKKKWQVALRRYILDRNISEFYAPYFGLDIEKFRNWIELQFTDDMAWENFGVKWQFDHIIPVSQFDHNKHDDLVLCWSFINIRVEKTGDPGETRIELLAAKRYFQQLYQKTGYFLCNKMLDKIISIENQQGRIEPVLANFMVTHKERLEKTATLSATEFKDLNQGADLENIFLEREILRKFG